MPGQKLRLLPKSAFSLIALNTIASVILSIQKFKVNAMLNAFAKRCVVFVVQYIMHPFLQSVALFFTCI